MKFLNFFRWIFFIPLGLFASALAGTLAIKLLKYIGEEGYFGGASWYIWLVNGLVSAYSLAWVSFYIAPKITQFCKWIIVGLMLFMALATFTIDPERIDVERIALISGVPLMIMGFILASWSPEEIKHNFGLQKNQDD